MCSISKDESAQPYYTRQIRCSDVAVPTERREESRDRPASQQDSGIKCKYQK